MKKIVFGIIIGIVLTVSANAAVQYTLKQSECKIVVDGTEVKGELPLLIMEPGFNYIPAAEFRSICDKIGIGFEFDSATKEIRIDTGKVQTSSVPMGTLEIKEGTVVSEVITHTPDGLKVMQYQGVNYIRWGELRKKCEFIGLQFDTKDSKFNFKTPDGTLLVSIPLYTIYSTQDSAMYDDYVNMALPLLGAE